MAKSDLDEMHAAIVALAGSAGGLVGSLLRVRAEMEAADREAEHLRTALEDIHAAAERVIEDYGADVADLSAVWVRDTARAGLASPPIDEPSAPKEEG